MDSWKYLKEQRNEVCGITVLLGDICRLLKRWMCPNAVSMDFPRVNHASATWLTSWWSNCFFAWRENSGCHVPPHQEDFGRGLPQYSYTQVRPLQSGWAGKEMSKRPVGWWGSYSSGEGVTPYLEASGTYWDMAQGTPLGTGQFNTIISYSDNPRLIDQPRLEGTSTGHLVQPFVWKGAYMRLSSTCATASWKRSVVGAAPHHFGSSI